MPRGTSLRHLLIILIPATLLRLDRPHKPTAIETVRPSWITPAHQRTRRWRRVTATTHKRLRDATIATITTIMIRLIMEEDEEDPQTLRGEGGSLLSRKREYKDRR